MNFPFFMLMIGPSQSGKTTWLLNFVKFFSFINPGHTLHNVLFLHMAEFINMDKIDPNKFKNITFHSLKTSMTENEEMMDDEIIKTINEFKKKVSKKKYENDHEHNLVIMDDMMMAVGSRRKMMHYVEELVTRKCHHENINYVFVIQDLMFSNSKFRLLFSNANYIVLFPNKSDNRNVKHILRSRGFNSKEINEILKEAFEMGDKTHPYLLLDSTVESFDNVRIRQGIFPDENLYIYNKIIE